MNHNETLMQIESLMLDLCDSSYRSDTAHQLERQWETATRIYDPEIDYSPMLQGYFDVMGINHSLPMHSRVRIGKSPSLSKTALERYCDELVLEQDDFIRAHRRRCRRNATTLATAFKILVSQHRKLLLVRVDVSYDYEANITIRQFNADLEVFRRRIHHKDTCFKGLLGYAWAIEQGRDKGYHGHFLFVYNGSKHIRDEYYGMKIGKLWQDITNDDGCYFNCNSKAHKDQYRRLDTLGIGMIHRSNQREVDNALKSIAYLAKPTKVDQYLRAKVKDMRCFGSSI